MTDHHLTIDELAELDEGLLSPEQAAAAREHLDGCDQCRAQAEAIATTRATLGSLPPVTMPADVVARIEGALAAEAAAAPPTPPIPTSTETVVPSVVDISTRSRWLNRPTLASAAVAAVFVLLVGAIVIGHSRNHHGGTVAASAPTGSGGVATAPSVIGPNQAETFTTTSSAHTYTAANLDTLVPQLLAPKAAPQVVPESSTASPPPSPVANGGVISGTPAQGGATHGPAGGDTSEGGSTTVAPSRSTPGSAAVDPGASPPSVEKYGASIPKALQPIASSRSKLLACAASLTVTPGAVPEAIDYARWTGGDYHNAPSIIMVFNGAIADTVTVFVVAPSCSGDALIRDVHVVSLSG